MAEHKALDPAALLHGSPYLIDSSPTEMARFSKVFARAAQIQARAVDAAASIKAQARALLPQFEVAIRSDLVSESDRMEGIDTSPAAVRQLVATRTDLLDADVGALIQFIRDDERLLESLGLYKAYAIADEWARTSQRPREFELRSLHALVMPSLPTAGAYKTAPNEIGGSHHVPVAPWDVARSMGELAAWFENGSGDAVLDAAVVHAWLAHIHPFDDGNGRMSRLLANLALVQAHYPPLLLRSDSDRGQYLDALAASDDGDILPLYDLFVSSLRRVVLMMEKPNYVEAKIRGDLLRTSQQRHQTWRGLAQGLFSCLEQKAKRTPWGVYCMGYPSLEDFDLLEQRNRDGNCWFAKIRERGDDRWLLWFGFRSSTLLDLLGEARPWPSIFASRRSDRPDAVHPYEASFELEASVCPGSRQPALLRVGLDVREMQVDELAKCILDELGVD